MQIRVHASNILVQECGQPYKCLISDSSGLLVLHQ